MRRFVSFVALTGCVQSCGIVGAPAQCGTIEQSQVVLNAHLAMTPDKLSGATLTFCRNGACATGAVGTVVIPDSGTTNEGNVSLAGSPLGVSASLSNELDGFTEVEMFPDISGLELNDGDTYGATITLASGATAFNVTRPVTYDSVDTCGSYSKQVRMELYPTSASGIACGNGWCSAGVHVTGSFQATDITSVVTITLCRNGSLCASGDVPLSALTAPNVQQEGGLDGDFLGAVTLSLGGNGFSYDVQSIEDTAALADGDTYSLTLAQGAALLVTGQAAATYTATYPNGSQCDPVACHQATLSIP